ncbi:MAG: gamma carbonic anhydrase family protein [Rickettsiales bacterium]
MTNIFPYFKSKPKIDKSAFIAPTASIVGDVTIGKHSGIWFNSVVRGDVAKVRIGDYTNVQDGTVIHVSRGGDGDTIIGDYVTIGHKAMIHACTLEDNCFVGMSAIIMDNAVVESGGWVATGALITENKVVRAGEIWAGYPAKLFRKLTDAEQKHIRVSAENYAKHAQEYVNMESW